MVTATFSEAVTGFTIGDITLTNGTSNSFTVVNSTTYSFNVVPSANGALTVRVNSDLSQDLAGNLNIASNTLSRTYDSVRPSVTLSSTTSDPTNTNPIPVRAVFTKSITGFTNSDIVVTNGTSTGFTAVHATTYTFNIIPTVDGVVTVNVPQNTSQDLAGNLNTASNTLSRNFDGTAPTIAVVTPVPATGTDTTPDFTFSSTQTGSTTYGGDCTSLTNTANT